MEQQTQSQESSQESLMGTELSILPAHQWTKIEVSAPKGEEHSQSFRSWRRGPHRKNMALSSGWGVMVPDRGFRKQLHTLDPNLEVVWDGGSQRWEIWRIPPDGRLSHHVMTVQTKDRGYAELSGEVLLKLQQADASKYTAEQFLNYLEELDKQVHRRKAKEFEDKIHAITMENIDWMRGVIKVQVPQAYRVKRAVMGTEE